MPRLETVKVPPESSGGVIVPSRTRCGQRPRLGRDLPQALAVGVEDGRHDERVLGGHRDADVDPRVELEAAVAVGAVGARVLAQRERAGLDDHVVEGGHDVALLRRRLEARPGLDRAAHVDLGLQVEVRRGRLRLGHPPGDGLLELRRAPDDVDWPLAVSGCSRDAGRRPGRRGRRRRGGRRRARGPAAAIAFSTSALTMRPPGPGALRGPPDRARARARSAGRAARP